MVHRQHAVVVAGESLEEDRVRGKGTAAANPARGGAGHGRRDQLDFLPPEQPAFAAVRIERGDGDAGLGEAGVAQRRVREGERLVDPLRRDLVERRAQRHVRGHARHPEIVENVHLAEEAAVARQVREHLVLVVEAPPAGVQRRPC